MWNSLFKKINLNWIMRLFSLIKNSQKYNSILIIVYCIMKYVLFILIWNNCTTADFAELFFEHVEYCFDFLKSIVMNKNSCITFNFWWVKLLFLVQFIYNNSCNHIIQMSSNRLLHEFDCEICIDVTDNITEKKISAAKNNIEKLHKLW